MAEVVLPDLTALMATTGSTTLNFNQCIVVSAGSVSGVGQTNIGQHEAYSPDLLRYLPGGLPLAVARRLGPFDGKLEREWVVSDAGLSDPIPLELGRATMALALDLYSELLEWCRNNVGAANIRPALDSLSRVARCLGELNPTLIIDLFANVEPALKYNGDFRLMLIFGMLTERACKAAKLRDAHTIERQTQATTCAHAWVLQRTGRLHEAERLLDADENLNDTAGIVRGLAFTLKCRGRLRRIMAERSDYAPTAETRTEYLRNSLSDLKRARAEFQHLDAGDRAMQVADTDSLMGRTFLVMSDIAAARRHWRSADLIARSSTNKTFLDQLILDDEITAAERMAEGVGPVSHTPGIDKVLELTERDDAVVANEIRARAFFARARLFAAAGRQTDDDVNQAVDIYTRLQEPHSVAQVQWWHLLTTTPLADQTRRMLEDLAPAVRVRAYQSYVTQHGVPELSALANRARDLGDVQWSLHIEAAQRADAVERGHLW